MCSSGCISRLPAGNHLASPGPREHHPSDDHQTRRARRTDSARRRGAKCTSYGSRQCYRQFPGNAHGVSPLADLADGRLFFPLMEHTLLAARVLRPADVSKTTLRQRSPLPPAQESVSGCTAPVPSGEAFRSSDPATPVRSHFVRHRTDRRNSRAYVSRVGGLPKSTRDS